MLSKKSYFKPALFLDDLRRFSPIWVSASLGLLCIPCLLFLQYQEFMRGIDMGQSSYTNSTLNTLAITRLSMNELLLNILTEAAPIAIMLYAVIPAMALLHYLCQSRSALGTHALPINRSALFLTHYTAGLAMMLLPLLIFCAVTIPVLCYAGAFWPAVLLDFCLGCLGMYLFFFSFAFFCGMFTGQLWGLPVFYAIFNGLASISFYLFFMLADNFLYGFEMSDASALFAQRLTPIWQLLEALHCESITAEGYFALLGLSSVAAYAVAGLLLATLSFAIFQNRHLERAGEIVTVWALRPVFILGLSGYAGFCFMLVFSALFGVSDLGRLFFFLGIGILFGFAIGKMLLEKTIAIFSLRNLAQAGSIFAAACLLFSCICFDLLGYEEYIPEAQDIASVSVYSTFYADAVAFSSGVPLTATGDAQIDLLRSTHAALLADYQETGEMYPMYTTPAVVEITAVEEPLDEGDPTAYTYYNSTGYISFVYTLTSGQEIHRSYYIARSESELAREGSPASYLEAFANSFDVSALLKERSADTQINLYYYSSDTNATLYDGTSVFDECIEAICADFTAQGTTLSTLRKDYLMSDTGSFSIYQTDDEFFYYGSNVSGDVRPGSYTEAFVAKATG
ncbi:MAG: hypothetical protein R3Y06_04260 [Faecalibacterium sp.]